MGVVLVGLRHVRGLIPLRAPHDLEGHFLSRRQGLEPVSLDGREMNEHVLPALLFDESVPLSGVEPLHSTIWHLDGPSFSASLAPLPAVASLCRVPVTGLPTFEDARLSKSHRP